jgi:methyltransferase OMS1, mitochondrial|eukprot:31156-Pelagococcus_subviridis.AAC.15
MSAAATRARAIPRAGSRHRRRGPAPRATASSRGGGGGFDGDDAASRRARGRDDEIDDARRPRRPSRRDALLAALALVPPTAATRASVEDIAEKYDSYASTYDVLDGGALASDDFLGIESMRASILSRASGDVLELGVGTGLNLPRYDAANITTLTAVDISDGMLELAVERAMTNLGDAFRVETSEEWDARLASEAAAAAAVAAASDGVPILPVPPSSKPIRPPPVRFMIADVEALPFDDASFDCVVDTFSLCVFEDPSRAMREVRRVLRPDGVALLVEHSRAPGALGWYQDLTAAPVKSLAKGCAWNQDVRKICEDAGLIVTSSAPSLFGTLLTVEATPGPPPEAAAA